MQTKLGWTVPFLLLLVAGCGNYTVTLRVGTELNTAGQGESNSEMLDVDIVCLTPADAKRYPGIANGSTRSRAWFQARQKQSGENISSLKNRIHALRGEAGELYGNFRDTRIGDALRPGEGSRTIKIHHPKALSKESVLLIYGRFQDGKGELLDAEPIVIQPPPKWNTDVVIDVGATRLVLIEEE